MSTLFSARTAGVALVLAGFVSLPWATVAHAERGGQQASQQAAGNPNAGDVWVDNVGNPSGPGHEMDPHLDCSDINLWGNGLADPSGTFTIDGWPPSGSQEQDYPKSGTASWTYDQSTGGSQTIAVIPVKTLVDNAIANGDAPVNSQGLHFKLQFSQDPQKHKTFWVNCPQTNSPGSPSTPTPTPTTTTGGVQGETAVAPTPTKAAG